MRFLQCRAGLSPRITHEYSRSCTSPRANCLLPSHRWSLKTLAMKIDLTGSPLKSATWHDWKQVGDITGEAFAQDPVNQWAFRKPASIRSMFRVMAREIYLRFGQGFIHPEGGATMWMPPGISAKPSRVGMLRFALGQIAHGTPDAIGRGQALSQLMHDWHPRDAHMYLFSIGTTKAARGKGVGKALLAPVLAACDEARLPVYLENSNPQNSGFYGVHGFERMGVFEIGGHGSPVMEPMWREPTP